MRDEEKALKCLQNFVKAIVGANIEGRKSYREWCKKNEKLMEKLFWYGRKPKMPSIAALIGISFHPTEPLIELNYTPVAHNTLHYFQSGWTVPLRLCRGIIFDWQGNLVAKPFTKFFNYGEHKETKCLPADESFEATVKHDGHLGIIFEYKERFFFTTRGSFESRSAIIGSKMLAQYCAKYKWDKKFFRGKTLLVELIHPKTKVHVEYHGRKQFILIGATDLTTLKDYNYGELSGLGKILNLPVTERWNGTSFEDLEKLMEDMTIQNQEGFVVRFKSGLRVKFKFATYINKMVMAKLCYRYLMKRIINGNLDKMIKNLPAEEFAKAREMIESLLKIQDNYDSLSEEEKKNYLYNLVPKKESNSGYRSICREFLKYIKSHPH